jgi:hypothetical protein
MRKGELTIRLPEGADFESCLPAAKIVLEYFNASFVGGEQPDGTYVVEVPDPTAMEVVGSALGKYIKAVVVREEIILS